ncbi:hypothetical protein M758_4G197700 [Ceratodon purpureus]|nr:hypothetical protein M758_4G197700 [Ceratodon purpureus]
MAHQLWLLVSALVLLSLASTVVATPEGDALIQVAKDWQTSQPSWLPGTDPCKGGWVGVSCDAQNISVISLNLTNANLQGPVPMAIGSLTSLQALDISNIKYSSQNLNNVTGNLSALATLQNLQNLNASRQNLGLTNTKFPEVIQTLSNLRSLTMDHALLPGPFPVGLTNLTKLEVMYLGNNSFTGPIPPELGRMTTLKELTIWGSNYNCRLPPELGNLVNLTYLNCNRCFLWGGLPPEYGKLKNLQKMHFYKNTLTGPIPNEYRNLTSLVELRLESNNLFGSLEPWVIGLPILDLLNLNFNQMYKSMPPYINRTTTNLTQFLVKCNYFTGRYPIVDAASIPTSELDANCFENPGVNGTLDVQCSRELSCIPFQNYLNSNGGCPPCPKGQYIANQTLCICFGDKTLSTKKTSITAIVGGVVGGIVALAAVALLLICLWIRRRKKFDLNHDFFYTVRDGDKDEPWEQPKGVYRYTLDDLKRATSNFSKEHEIGSGGFGKVFSGKFPGNKTLAIKRASISTSANGQTQFRNEVLLLSRLHHKNLVRLEGFCDENDLQILVYEFMRNGNLHNHLFRKSAGKYLNWYKRLEIAVQIAQGLEYLHSFADPPVIHRDVKPSNILLDDNLVAKVADFGISKESPELHTHVSTHPAGTIGYFDPEYFTTQKLTTASDVYSYGVVLLELLTGQKVIDHVSRGEEYNLIKWVEPRLRDGGIDLIVDPKLEGNYSREIFQQMAELALHCSASEKKDRPTMKAVVIQLEPLLQEADQPQPTSHMVWIDPSDSTYTPDNESIFTGSTTGSSSNHSFSIHSATETHYSTFDPR